MRTRGGLATFGFVAAILSAVPATARVTAPVVTREGPNTVTVSWQGAQAVDVFIATKADASIAEARLISSNDRDGTENIAVDGPKRPYFLVRDRMDGSVTEVAERLLPLEQGSNFRDIGGYATSDGRTVRWGTIFRSGATPMLTEGDKAKVRALGLQNMLDLRSDEERQLAPTKIDGVQYRTFGYSMMDMLDLKALPRNGSEAYRNFPRFLAPQMRILFSMLVRGEGPLAYNCSAGQDRTGFATALILSALGVPREAIIKDYLLSTASRRPQYELPQIDPALYKDNPVAQLLGHMQKSGAWAHAEPLMDANGTPFLAGALAEIDAKWGSVDNYLRQEIGLTDEQLATLRGTYLE